MRQTRMRFRGGAIALAGLLASVTLFPAVAMAGPTPEQTIAAIQAKAQAAQNWIDNRADQYYDFLATNPSPSAALTELNRAISDINAKAAEAEVDITGKMAQHPSNPDVQQEGRDAIANVWDTAASEIDSMSVAYNAYIGGTTTTTTTTVPSTTTTVPSTTTTTKPPSTTTTTKPPTTTTTTVSTTTTTKPPTVTTTTVTLPPVTTTTLPSGTTTLPGSTVTTSTTTTIAGPIATTSTTTTTLPDLVAAATPPPPQPPLSTASLASKLGSMAAVTSAQPLNITSQTAVAEPSSLNVSSVLELVRISLPAGVAQPIVDVLIIVQAVAAAFVSGALALAWPAAVLLVAVLIQALRRWTPVLRRPDEAGAESGAA